MSRPIRFPQLAQGLPAASQPTATLAGPTQAFPLDIYSKGQVHIQVNFTGGPVTVEVTDSDIYDPKVTPVWFNHSDAGAVAATAPFVTAFTASPRAVRLNGTATGLEMWIIENGST